MLIRILLILVSIFFTKALIALESENTNSQIHNIDTIKGVYIVQLESSSITKLARETLKLNKKQTTQTISSVNSSALAVVSVKQNALLSGLQKIDPKLKEVKRFSKFINAVVVESELSVQEIKQQDDVKSVYPLRRYFANLNNLNSIINSQQAWELVGGMEEAGKGIKVAVIDTGIDPDHLMFSDTGYDVFPEEDRVLDDYCATAEESFCNNKLILARHFLSQYTDLQELGEFDSPRAVSGHGTHVAGIAVGREVFANNIEYISGVAPGAYLMVYKALWGSEGTGTDIELLEAVTAAGEDEPDIINNSWGGEVGQSPNGSIYKDIYEELEANGILIVTAAGNDGQSGISCPACIEAGITVGATSSLTELISAISFGELELSSSPSSKLLPPMVVQGEMKRAPEDNNLMCVALPANYFMGKIAVANRGDCLFEEKATFAEDAGAIAMILIDNVYDDLITMDMGNATLPAMLIKTVDGENLLGELALNPENIAEIYFKAVATDNQLEIMMDFSGIGPNGDSSVIKPDLVAPGGNILSASTSLEQDSLSDSYAYLSGTSMAAPSVAGAAAVLKQYRPTLSAKAMKEILSSSSTSEVYSSSGRVMATPFEKGAGRMDLSAAMLAKSFPEKTNMAILNCLNNCIESNRLIHASDESVTWQGVVSFDNSLIDASLNPHVVTMSSYDESKEFEIEIDIPQNLESNWYYGNITWTNEIGEMMNQSLAMKPETIEPKLLDITTEDLDSGDVIVEISSVNLNNESSLVYVLDIEGEGQFNLDSFSYNGVENATILESSETRIIIEAEYNDLSTTLEPGLTLGLSNSGFGAVVFSIIINRIEGSEFAFDDTAVTLEERSKYINVLANDDKSSANIKVSVEDETVEENIFSVTRDHWLDEDSLTIVELPQNGEAYFSTGNLILYIPVTDFYGEDSFKYSVSDNMGNSSIAEVIVNVENVNDSPIIEGISSKVEVNENESFTIEVHAIDADNDDLVVEWKIPEEFTLISSENFKVNLKSNSVLDDTLVEIEAIVSDGEFSDMKSVNLTLKNVVKKDNGLFGGNFNIYWSIYLFLLLMIKVLKSKLLIRRGLSN